MPTSAAPLLDASQLSRRSMGDPALEVELLALFVAEVERLMRQIDRTLDPRLRRERLEALAVAARNVGAARLVQAARSAEPGIDQEEPDLAPLRAAVAETIAYVNGG